MPIPKVIYQTYKGKIPWYSHFYIWRFRRKNKDFEYEFYNDERIDSFIKENFPEDIYYAYCRLQIGAAKADFFRYAILYKKGGVYLDIDSDILVNLNTFIQPNNNNAILAYEENSNIFAQWALFYEKNHPFLEETIKLVVKNIQENRYPYNVHAMTGPSIYTLAIRKVLFKNPDISFRMAKRNFKGILKSKYMLARILMNRRINPEHWRRKQLTTPVAKPE
ncbi:glycosyltransferase family 32 protein [Elizabethkingia sp. M8]|uniref:glycosyltransferase family 32 protein n=1 Tax=Elizabethkingia sp. M8 TaxID=2796140 RepID=UPI0019040BC7|nr:glycosyltransferase [Elizabethkingia sp. M8]QQM26721.1 glycosyl transferase [Elizabethkingia sp. M8]